MVKGILFDKDGTLIDFFSLWLQAALEVIPQLLEENEIESTPAMVEYLLQVIGVQGETVDPLGALAYKSYVEMADMIREALAAKGIALETAKIHVQLEVLFHRSVTSRHASLLQLTDLRDMTRILRERSILVGLATADTIASAQSCLESLDVLELFAYVGADDGIKRPKPEKDMFLEFQQNFGLHAEEIAVVGDTYNDIVFARQNGGIAIGVLSGVSTLKDFRGEADYVIDSIQQLPELLDQIQEEQSAGNSIETRI
ncbi:MAG: HAD family hydrolase [Lachnospiraceae bacterium]